MARNAVGMKMESAALGCIVLGFALYVAVDNGVIRLPSSQVKTPENIEAKDLTLPQAQKELTLRQRLQKVNELKAKMEFVETKLKERADSLQKTNQELDVVATRIADERQRVNTMATLVDQITSQREEFEHSPEGLLLSSARPIDPGPVENALNEMGMSPKKVSNIRWRNREYVRLVQPFEFQQEGIYMLPVDIDRATALAQAALDSAVREMKIVYNDVGGDDDSTERERAYVLRNFMKSLMGDDARVVVSPVEDAMVAAGTIELWMGKK